MKNIASISLSGWIILSKFYFNITLSKSVFWPKMKLAKKRWFWWMLHCGCPHQCVLYLCRAKTMAADIDDVVHSPGYLVVSVYGAERSITGEIKTWGRTSADRLPELRQSVSNRTPTWIRFEIRLNESLVVSINTAGHPRPRLTDAQITADRVSFQAFTLKTTRETSHKDTNT